MSVFSNAGNATLGEIIAHLEKLPRDRILERGFRRPHSYRGYYEDLAFEPIQFIGVGFMLDEARSALGKTFEGYKGGQYKMHEGTDCWLAEWGCTGVPIMLPGGRNQPYFLPEP